MPVQIPTWQKYFVFSSDLAVSVTEEEVIQAADAVRTIRFDDQELKSSQTASDQASKTKSKDHSKKPTSSHQSHQYYHQGSSSSGGRKHHASPSAPTQKVGFNFFKLPKAFGNF